jgi:hypothetical protein
MGLGGDGRGGDEGKVLYVKSTASVAARDRGILLYETAKRGGSVRSSEVAQAVLGKCTKSNLEIGRRKSALRGFSFVTVGRRFRSDPGEACVGELRRV